MLALDMKGKVCALFFAIVVAQCCAVQQLTPPYTCTTTICQPGNPVASEVMRAQRHQGPPGKRGGLGPKGDKGDPCHCDVADEEAMESLRNEWRNKAKQYDDIMQRLNRLEDVPENCSAVQKSRSGENNFDAFDVVPIYPLKFIGDVTPWMVNCTKILSDGTDGWITIQRRQDGGTDFYRNWDSYAKGFGNRQEEFWLGLRNIHLMTTKRRCKLKIDLKDFSGRKRYAQYNSFKVSSEDSLFRLTVAGYSGNVPDSFAYHNGSPFSAIDKDNDRHSTIHCSRHNKGPWWHHSCDRCNLNGVYEKISRGSSVGVRWDGFAGFLPYAEMKLFCL